MRLFLPMGLLSVVLAGVCQGEDYEEAYRLRERREILPLEELLRRQDLGPGTRILEVETEFEEGRPRYEIEYLDSSGRIREVLIDAHSGKALSDEKDH